MTVVEVTVSFTKWKFISFPESVSESEGATTATLLMTKSEILPKDNVCPQIVTKEKNARKKYILFIMLIIKI
ncbi:hypothetical protein D3C87_1208660 [compost metagenome]